MSPPTDSAPPEPLPPVGRGRSIAYALAAGILVGLLVNILSMSVGGSDRLAYPVSLVAWPLFVGAFWPKPMRRPASIHPTFGVLVGALPLAWLVFGFGGHCTEGCGLVWTLGLPPAGVFVSVDQFRRYIRARRGAAPGPPSR